MNKVVKVYKHNLIFLIICSVIISLICCSIFYIGFNIWEKSQIEVYATNDNLNLEDVEIIEERTIPVIVEKEITVEKNPFILKKIGDFNLTAYCPCNICCEQWGGSPEGKTTSIGIGAYQGITIAVDPSKIPYGSKVYIEGVGVCIAADCGGAIKGNRIDVYFNNHSDALAFGRGGGVSHAVYIIE